MKKIVLFFVISFLYFVPTIVLGQNSDIIEKANHAFKSGKYADAENLYNTAADYASGDDVNIILLKAKNAARAAALQKDAEKAWNLGDKSTSMQKYEDLLKLNPDDQVALSRVNEMEKAKQLEKAMYLYNKKEYAQALELFNSIGSSTMWNNQQKNAYKRCQMEIDYNNWKTSSSEALAEARAIRFLADYPNSIYDKEIRESLFNYYLNNKQYDKASNYAVTVDQKRQLAMTQQSNDSRLLRKQSEGTATVKSSAIQNIWEPTFGLAAELSLFGSLIDGLDEAALPVEFRLLNQNSVLNVSLGARIGIRGMFLPDTLRSLAENTSSIQQIEASFSYCQLSPFVNVKLHLGKAVSSGAFFLGFTGRLNYNFNYTFYKTESVNNQYGAQYGNKFEYHTKDLLTPITPSIVGELGYGSEAIEFYIYFSYDVVNSIDYSKVMQMRNNPENPHSQILSQSSFADRYTNDIFVGAGLRVYFGD